jgi:hypothetical protein
VPRIHVRAAPRLNVFDSLDAAKFSMLTEPKGFHDQEGSGMRP